MARAASGAATRSRSAGTRRNAMLGWGGLGCGALVVLSPGSAALLLALLAPVALVALLPGEERSGQAAGRLTRAALLFGLAASIHPLRLLWEAGASIATATTMMREPFTLLTAWTAICAGWLTSELAGIVLGFSAEIAAVGQRRRLAASVAALEEEWGPLPPPITPPG